MSQPEASNQTKDADAGKAVDEELEQLESAEAGEPPNERPTPRPSNTKPILWVGVTSSYKGQLQGDQLARIRDWIEEQAGDDYHTVVAPDTVRAMDAAKNSDDLERFARELQDLKFVIEDALEVLPEVSVE